ncbi:MAG TPA: ATP synthase F1 subunit delta [Thermoanaerobaculia bacterium]|nr:ATP synthase F1 subunit delta [Thermoanaerobaculia bacterium]
MIRRFARPYARAIMDVAASPEAARNLHTEMKRFEQALGTSRDLRELFASPAVHVDQKIAVASTLGAKLELSALAQRVIEVLIRNHRIVDLDAILAGLLQMIHEALAISVARVRTAHELSEEQRRDLTRALEQRFGGKIDLELAVDTALLGGFVAQVGSEIYDASVRGQLNLLKETIT